LAAFKAFNMTSGTAGRVSPERGLICGPFTIVMNYGLGEGTPLDLKMPNMIVTIQSPALLYASTKNTHDWLQSPPPDSGFSMMIPDSRDQTNVFLTRAPNESAVWMIQRSQNFTATEPMSETALLTALREKYGKETLTMDRGDGGLYLFWIFDQSGKLRSTADQGLTGCSGGSFINYSVNGPPQTPNSIEQACFQSFFAVTAMLNRHDAQMLQAYTVELVNIPYAVSAATNTLHANNAAADKARQDLLIKANQEKPSF
jgi:hypothetical protein